MTSNQSSQLVKNPNTKKAITVLQKYADLEMQLKVAKKEADEATELIKNAMVEAGVPRIEIDLPELTGYITLAERTNYKTENIMDVPIEFTKATLDTDKVKATQTLTGLLPVGVTESKIQYITKKFKAAE